MWRAKDDSEKFPRRKSKRQRLIFPIIYSIAIITHILTYTGYALIHLGKRVHGDLQIDQHLFFTAQFFFTNRNCHGTLNLLRTSSGFLFFFSPAVIISCKWIKQVSLVTCSLIWQSAPSNEERRTIVILLLNVQA